MLGEANDYALRQILGLPPSQIESLTQREIIGNRPIGGNPPRSTPLPMQAELGWIANYNPDFPNPTPQQ